MNKKTTPKKLATRAIKTETATTSVRHSAVPPKTPTAAAVAERPEATAAAKVPVATAPVAAAPVAAEKNAKVTALIEQLRNPVAEVAVESTEKLADFGAADTRIGDALVDVLRNVDGYFNLVTRAAAAMALGRLKDGRSVETLIATTNDGQAEVSCEAVLALGQLKAKAALPTLHNIVANNGGFFLNVTRHAAIRALGQIGDAGSRTTLQAVIDAGWEDTALVSAAREALKSL